MQFFPLESMSNLIVEPFTRLSIIRNIKTTIGASNIKDYDVHFTSILIVLLWTTIFIFLSYKIICTSTYLLKTSPRILTC
jgi:hypothetical protein